MADNAKAIKDVVGALINKLAQKDVSDKTDILARWPKIVGKRAALHSRPVSLRRAQLTVAVDSSGWLYELSSEKRNIMKKLGGASIGAPIKNIRFRIGVIKQ